MRFEVSGLTVELPDALYRHYVSFIRDRLVGAVVDDLARVDAHDRIKDWVWDTYGATINCGSFERELSKAIDRTLEREVRWEEAPARLRVPGRGLGRR